MSEFQINMVPQDSGSWPASIVGDKEQQTTNMDRYLAGGPITPSSSISGHLPLSPLSFLRNRNGVRLASLWIVIRGDRPAHEESVSGGVRWWERGKGKERKVVRGSRLEIRRKRPHRYGRSSISTSRRASHSASPHAALVQSHLAKGTG